MLGRRGPSLLLGSARSVEMVTAFAHGEFSSNFRASFSLQAVNGLVCQKSAADKYPAQRSSGAIQYFISRPPVTNRIPTAVPKRFDRLRFLVASQIPCGSSPP